MEQKQRSSNCHSRPQPMQRILLVRNDRIGDLILTLPAMEAVRRQWPQAHLAALVSPYTAPLLTNSRLVNELLIDDAAHNARWLGGRLKDLRFDAALVFNTNTRNCLAVWHAGIRQRVTWAYKPAGFLLGNRRVALHRSHPPIHETNFTLAFARAAGADVDCGDLAPRLEIDPLALASVGERLRRDLGNDGPLFAVHPGNKNSAYNWPLANYARLVDRLAEHGRVLVSGSAAEAGALAEIHAELSPQRRKRVAFYSDLKLPELVAAMSLVTSLTVSSTGPMHIAGILGRPVVALFSPHPVHSPLKWAPMGRQHTLLVAPLEPGEAAAISAAKSLEVMARIPVEQVLDANLRIAQGVSSRTTERAA